MPPAPEYPMPRERNLIIGALLVLAAAAWVLIIRQAALGDRAMGLTGGVRAPVFLGVWTGMMVAMMFPTAMPVILTFARVQAGRGARNQTTAPVSIFVAAYLLVWTAFGAAAFGLASAGEALADRSMLLMDNAARIGGGAIVVAGLYQLSPLKRACLSNCRAPFSWIVTSWRDGGLGALRMGVEHGLYCIGCCWLLLVILFPLGMTNIAVMAMITVLIFAEKSLPAGRRAATFAAAALILYGAVVLALPAALPTA